MIYSYTLSMNLKNNVELKKYQKNIYNSISMNRNFKNKQNQRTIHLEAL